MTGSRARGRDAAKPEETPAGIASGPDAKRLDDAQLEAWLQWFTELDERIAGGVAEDVAAAIILGTQELLRDDRPAHRTTQVSIACSWYYGHIVAEKGEVAVAEAFRELRELVAKLVTQKPRDLDSSAQAKLVKKVPTDLTTTASRWRQVRDARTTPEPARGALESSARVEGAAPQREREPAPTTTALQVAAHNGYSHGEISADCIRLVGAADEWFPRDTLHVTYEPESRYVLPQEIQESRDAILTELERRYDELNVPFFEGENSRTLRFRASPRDGSEQKHIEVTLGPIGWFDFQVALEWTSRLRDSGEHGVIAKLVDLDAIASKHRLEACRFPTITETATTVVTRDDRIVVSKRKAAAYSGRLSCAVAENIHTTKDLRGTVPDPYRAVRRGIGEELSETLERVVCDADIQLLGVCFNCEEFHPTFLFLARIRETFDEMMKVCRDDPGKDFNEGKFVATPARLTDPDLRHLLVEGTWVESGKASVLRALEYLARG